MYFEILVLVENVLFEIKDELTSNVPSKPQGSIICTFKFKQALNLIIAAVFWGISGLYRAMCIIIA